MVSVTFRSFAGIGVSVAAATVVLGWSWQVLPDEALAWQVAALAVLELAIVAVVAPRLARMRVEVTHGEVRVFGFWRTHRIPWSSLKSVSVVPYWLRGGDGVTAFAPALELTDGNTVRLPGVPSVLAATRSGGDRVRSSERRVRILTALYEMGSGAGVTIDSRIKAALVPVSSPSWRIDPENPLRERWWDGQRWTDATRDVPVPLLSHQRESARRLISRVTAPDSVSLVALIATVMLVGGAVFALIAASAEVSASDSARGEECVASEREDPCLPEDEDQLVALGECAFVAEDHVCLEEATMESDGLQEALDRFSPNGGSTLLAPDKNLVITTRVRLASDTNRFIEEFKWSVITPSGETVESTVYLGEDQFPTRIRAGAETVGRVAFDIGPGSGTYRIVYQPNLLGGERATWEMERPG